MGRRKFGPQQGPWENLDWQGWWGDNPVYHTPCYVLTHYPRPSIELKGGTTFHFLDATPAEALAVAREGAGGRDVRIGGGPSTVRAYLEADLIDYLDVIVVPVVIGRGHPAVGRARPAREALPRRVAHDAQRRDPRDVQPLAVRRSGGADRRSGAMPAHRGPAGEDIHEISLGTWPSRGVAKVGPATFLYMSATVGIAELRQNLSRYLERVANGERLLVTDHNRPVAELGPPPAVGAALDRLIAEGRVSRPVRRGLPPALTTDADPHALSRALDEIRGDRQAAAARLAGLRTISPRGR